MRTGRRVTGKGVGSFKERLKVLMGDDKPYAWCRKVQIEKGLFQYYWQKGKIPKYENLLKIRNYTGCSLDWLMTGEGDPFPDRLESVIDSLASLLTEVDGQINRLEGHLARLRSIRQEIGALKP
ncbi:MAG: hypothetical protein HQK87_01090 [Nitrospinae bacterium]|nr:hypothetical protein [Nitrospinota bacterium]